LSVGVVGFPVRESGRLADDPRVIPLAGEAGAMTAADAADADDRPNVLLLVQEDVSPRYGCYGDSVARTPNIDAFASEARRYENAFCPAPVCAPSRASMMTGLHPPSLGAQHMRTDTHDVAGLPDSYDAVPPHYVTAFTERLRQAGYYCTLDSKTDYQFGEPFTMWDRHADGADWRDDRRDPDQPFFAMLTNGATHESGMWDPDEFDPHGRAVPDPETDPDAVDVPPYLPDTEPTRLALARHYDNLAHSDRWVGEVLNRLANDGHADETVVVLTSDHGEGLPRCKRWPYDSGTRVPLVVRWPGRTGGEVSHDLVSHVDLAPTMLSLAGVDPPRYLEGSPFFGPDATTREYVFATRDRYDESYDMVRSVRDDRFRYLRHYYPERPYVQHVPYRNRHPAMRELLRLDAEEALDPVQSRWLASSRPAEELYDLRADPHETENLADDPRYAEVLDRLRGALDDWRARTGDRERAAESELEMRDRVYPDGEQPTTAPPQFVPNAPGNRGTETTDGGAFEGPMTVSLYCPMQGASIAYATAPADSETGTDDTYWQIYAGPIRLESGDELTLRAKAVRYGYAESQVASATVRVSDA
jgi:arylsulfatase A-like enzyme